MKKKQININKFIPLFSVVSVLIIWELFTVITKVDAYILPRFSDVIVELFSHLDLILKHTVYTLFEAISGLLISVVIAFIFAIVLDKFKRVKQFVYPLLAISQTVPLMAIAPLLIIWFGLGVDAKVLIVVLVCFFPITINILGGFDEIDPDELDLFKTMHASTFDLYRKLKIPYSMPYFFSGLRIATTYAVLGALIGEYMGGTYGLGIYISRAMRSYSVLMVFGIIIVLVVSTLLLLGIVGLLENITVNYKKENNE